MFGRRRVVQNELVASLMRGFFRRNGTMAYPEDHVKTYGGTQAWHIEKYVRAYAEFLWNDEANGLVAQRELTRSRYHVGLSTGKGVAAFADITKRAALVSDTLLLTHAAAGTFHELGVPEIVRRGVTEVAERPPVIGGDWKSAVGQFRSMSEDRRALEARGRQVDTYGMYCPDMAGVARWLSDARPLLEAGMAWYLPSYGTTDLETVNGQRRLPLSKLPRKYWAINYLVKDGRAVDASGAEPIKGRLVRPILQAELPFLQGVNLKDFSKITINEFGSYASFRDFLRLSLLELDDSLNDVQSDVQLAKLGLRINDQVRAARAEMVKAQRKRAVSASGAVLGAVGAILVAVYGPALKEAIAAIGLTGGVWGVIQAASDNTASALREDKWYYVWVLAKKGNNRY